MDGIPRFLVRLRVAAAKQFRRAMVEVGAERKAVASQLTTLLHVFQAEIQLSFLRIVGTALVKHVHRFSPPSTVRPLAEVATLSSRRFCTALQFSAIYTGHVDGTAVPETMMDVVCRTP